MNAGRKVFEAKTLAKAFLNAFAAQGPVPGR